MSWSRSFVPVLLIASSLAAMPRSAQATWSVIAVDPETREVGAAGATCGPFVWMIAQVEPDAGAVVSLFATNVGARKDIAAALGEGESPEAALEPVLVADYDDELGIRQYAVVGFDGLGAVYTGDECDDWKGAFAEDYMAVAGNTLVSELVLGEVALAYQAAQGEPLADRLLAALEAGAAQGGDSRCDPEVAAESAFLFVAQPDDGRPTIDLTASSKDGAVAALRDKYDGGKRRNLHCSSAGDLPSGLGLLGLLGILGLLLRRRAEIRLTAPAPRSHPAAARAEGSAP